MKIKFLLLTAACIGMIACSKEDAEGPGTSDAGSKQIVLKVNLPASTRAINPDDPYVSGPGATKISSMDVYFTNANGTVQKVYTIKDEGVVKDLTNITTTGLRFADLNNVSSVYVVANQYNTDAEDVNPVDGKLSVGDRMSEYTTLLRNQGPALDQNNMVLAGCDLDITPVELDSDKDIPNYSGNPGSEDNPIPADNDQAYTANITIRPLISRIEWGNITLQNSGSKLVQSTTTKKYYLVEWANWKPELVGIYQSNVYLAESIFTSTKPGDAVSADFLFDTPTNTTAIVKGAWAKPTKPATGDNTWVKINNTLAYSGYAGSSYGALLPDDYDGNAKCVPFHFFVPFNATTEGEIQVPGTQFLPETPNWHFQLYYPDITNGSQVPAEQFTVTVYESDEDGTKGKVVNLGDNDDALSIAGNFYYPTREDGLAYANVNRLLSPNAAVGSTDVIKYLPGKIYTADITISPFNVTPGFKTVTDYNVIVKVNVVDFATVEVKPGFDKE